VSFVDVHIFADELASYGPEVRVVEPAELRDQVIVRLQRARDLHAGGVS
jgi:proteasome accessory factor B